MYKDKHTQLKGNEMYNGHPSYEHWNAELWFGNDEGLYRCALVAGSPEDLALMFDGEMTTPDGVKMTPELWEYAWRSVDEEREEGEIQ